MEKFIRVLTAVLFLVLAAVVANAEGADAAAIERGRYLVVVGGCNDCHTPGYAERDGNVPEADWLVGVPVGFNGPWGTSYPANLRLDAQNMDEQQFAARSRSRMLPPMPWFNLAAMSDEDLASIYLFIRSLGPAGQPAPAYAAPGVEPRTPYIVFVPTNAATQPVAAN